MGIISRKREFWTKLGVFPSSKIKFLPVAVPGRLRYEANEELRAGYARLCYSWLCPWWLLHSGFCFVFFFSCPQHKYYMFFDLHWTPVVNTGGRQAGCVSGGLGAGQRHHFSLVHWAFLLPWVCVWVLTFCNRCFHCLVQQALSLCRGVSLHFCPSSLLQSEGVQAGSLLAQGCLCFIYCLGSLRDVGHGLLCLPKSAWIEWWPAMSFRHSCGVKEYVGTNCMDLYSKN